MKESITELIYGYKKRADFLALEIIRLRSISQPTPKEIIDLKIIVHSRILWEQVIQDLKKITDKS